MGDKINGVRIKKTLSMMEVQNMLNSLSALSNGYSRINAEGRTITDPFKMRGRTRMSLAQNIAELRSRFVTYQEELSKKQRELGMSEEDPTLSPDLMKKLSEYNSDLLSARDDYDLIPISETELFLDDNPISPIVLSNILPIVDFDVVALMESVRDVFVAHVEASNLDKALARFDEVVGVERDTGPKGG